MRREIKVNSDYDFTFKFYESGLQLVPSSSTITITNNAGTEVVSSAGIIDVSTGDIDFTFTSTVNTVLDENFRVEVVYVVGGVTKYYYELFDTVYTPLVNICSDENLFVKLPELRTKIASRIDTTTETGSTTELRCLNLVGDGINYKGGRLEIYVSDTAVHKAVVVDYDADAGSCIFEPAYSSSITGGLTFKIRSSYKNIIDDAFDLEVQRDVRNRVGIASRFIDSNVLVNLTTYKALELYCLSQIEVEGDKWDIRMRRYMERYHSEFAGLSEPLDRDDNGQISDSENAEKTQMNMVRIIR